MARKNSCVLLLTFYYNLKTAVWLLEMLRFRPIRSITNTENSGSHRWNIFSCHINHLKRRKCSISIFPSHSESEQHLLTGNLLSWCVSCKHKLLTEFLIEDGASQHVIHLCCMHQETVFIMCWVLRQIFMCRHVQEKEKEMTVKPCVHEFYCLSFITFRLSELISGLFFLTWT